MNLDPIDKIVCIDFDNTIIAWEDHKKPNPKPFRGVVQAIQKLKGYDYYIVIFTSRLSGEWLEHAYKKYGYDSTSEFGAYQLRYIQDVLNDNLIPWDKITSEKVPAAAYFDDKAIRVSPGNLLAAVDGLIRGIYD